MCTILTFSKELWDVQRQELVARIQADWAYNRDGVTLLGIDPLDDANDVLVSAMSLAPVLKQLKRFFGEASQDARVWLHLRAATTRYVGVAFNHGFTDHQGRFIFHNGIISNTYGLAVDSFNLVYKELTSAEALAEGLSTERFANVMVVDAVEQVYHIVRQQGGALHTDGQGNYSTNPVGTILQPVGHLTAFTHGIALLGNLNNVSGEDYPWTKYY